MVYMTEFPQHSHDKYESKHILSDEKLKTAIRNSSKFLSSHTRVEMLHYFDSDPWIGRQIVYYMKLLDEENWSAVKLYEQALEREWKQHKKLMGFSDVTLTAGVKKK